jgi:MinD superfamily P-loop ATPase
MESAFRTLPGTTDELVVISGKGGTGKTSITASLALLTERVVVADCDVDAADLYLLLSPEVLHRETFRSGHVAVIREESCTLCGNCLRHCRFEAVREDGERVRVDPLACEGCGVCVRFCPEEAIDFPERECGEWFLSDTRRGPMVHARLDPPGENSGKLVSLVRQEARRAAQDRSIPLVLVDGPPGIGCPVIASVTGATRVLVVAEPTVAGIHDMERALGLTEHFGIPTAVCVNKWDLNPALTQRIVKVAEERGAFPAGRVRYDRAVIAAQMEARAVVERPSGAADDIRSLWANLGGTHATLV